MQSGEQADVTPGDIRKLTFPYTDRISGETTDIPLKDIAEFEEGESLNVINRSSQTRYISVTAGVDEDHNVTLVSDQIQKELDKIKLPDGYEISMTGEDETIRDAMNQLYLMLILAVVFIYLIIGCAVPVIFVAFYYYVHDSACIYGRFLCSVCDRQ